MTRETDLARVHWLHSRATAAIAAHDFEESDRLLALMDKTTEKMGEDMPTAKFQSGFTTITTGFVDNVMKGLVALADLDAAKDTMYPAAYDSARNRILIDTRFADATARKAIDAHVAGAYQEADNLRAQALADRDPAQRFADVAERQALVAGGLNGDEFLRQAQAALRASRPERAEFLLSVADAKGTRVPVELSAAVNTALDEAIPQRKAAVEIEALVLDQVSQFELTRLGTLTRAGVGVDESGEMGTGHPAEVAMASSRLKLMAAAKAEREGVPYTSPAGALAEGPNVNGAPDGAQLPERAAAGSLPVHSVGGVS